MYNYDLNNPKEKEMFLNNKIEQYKRTIDRSKTAEQKAFEAMQQHQKEKEYFMYK
jgi:hypothetical protein